MSHHGIERRIHVADEIRDAILVRVYAGQSRRSGGNAPSDFERIGQKISIGIRAGRQGAARSAPDVHIAVRPSLGLRFGQVALVCLDVVDQTVVVVVVVLDLVAGRDLTQEDAGVADGGSGLPVDRRRGGEQVVPRSRYAPRVIPSLGVPVDRDIDPIADIVAVFVGEQLGRIANLIVVQVEESFARIELVVVIEIGECLRGIPPPVAVGVGESFTEVIEAIAVGIGERLGRIPLAVVVGIGARLLVVPPPVAVGVGEGLLEESDRGIAGQGEVVDRGAGLDANRVVEAVGARAIGQDDFRRPSVGAELARAGDADERLGAGVGPDQTHRLEFPIVRERVENRERVPEIRQVVVHVGQRNGQLVERVADVVIDVEIAAALDDSAAIGSVLGAGDTEREAVLELLFGQAIGKRLGEIHLHRVVVVDHIAVALRPRDIHTLVGSARLHGAHHLGDACRAGRQVDIARRGRLMQADGDAGLSCRRNVVVAETPFLLVRQVGGSDLRRLTPRLRERGVVLVVAVDVGVFLAALTDAVLVRIDERLETSTVAVEDFGGRVVVAAFAVGDVEPHVLDGQVGVDDEFVARAADRVAIAGREEHRAGRRQRVVVKDLRECVVERRGAERAPALAIGQVSPRTNDVEALAEPGLHSPRP